MPLKIFNPMIVKKHWFILLSVCFLISCSSVSVTSSSTPFTEKALKLEKQGHSSSQKRQYDIAIGHLLQSLKIFSLIDDLKGQMRIKISLAKLYWLKNKPKLARFHINQALQLNKETGETDELYDAWILRGKITQQQGDYTKALNSAKTPIQKAVSLIYLKQTEQAYALINNEKQITHHRDDYAFVTLEYGKFHHNVSIIEKALKLYKQTDNFIGISNCLYLIAETYSQSGQNSLAKKYFNRALIVNQAIGDQNKVDIVRNKLERL